MTDLPVQLLLIAPLALAAGIDLYLTLLFIGAGAATGLWEPPLPGALADLDAPGVLVMVGTLYVAELTAERFAPAAFVWNVFHAVVRPVSGALLTLLLLDGQPTGVVVVGAVVGGLLTSLAHSVRTGAWVLRALTGGEGAAPLLLSVAEDVAVLGAVSLALDAPLWAFGLSLILLVSGASVAPSSARAFAYAVRLGIGRAFRALDPGRWRRTDELPEWIVAAIERDDETAAHVETLRGCAAGAWGLPGAPRFAVGWIVVRGGRSLFVFRSRRGPRSVALGAATSIRDRALWRRVELEGDGSTALLFVGWSGPSTEGFEADLASRIPTESSTGAGEAAAGRRREKNL